MWLQTEILTYIEIVNKKLDDINQKRLKHNLIEIKCDLYQLNTT
jgi:hypothetical protein